MSELTKQGGPPSPKQTPAFAKVIDRLQNIVEQNALLTNKAFDKSCRIANTQRTADSIDTPKANDSIIGILHSIIDQLENNNSVLQLVFEDLEAAIP